MKINQLIFYLHITWHTVSNTPSIFVLAYPRSGSSWLSRLLATTFAIPYGRRSSFFSPQVIHLHRFFLTPYQKKRTIYIVRDVRDCFISYSNALKNELNNGKTTPENLKARFGISINDLDPNTAGFLNFCHSLMHTKQASTNWLEHVMSAANLGLTIIRFEDLKNYPEATLSNTLKLFPGNLKVDINEVLSIHNIETERANGLPVRSGKTEHWREFAGSLWVKEVTAWAYPGLKAFGYDIGN